MPPRQSRKRRPATRPRNARPTGRDRPSRVLAVFAHPDDEIGCVGTLANHVRNGDEVLLVWTTYGENASHFNGVGPKQVARVREGHGKRVGRLIGCATRFLDFPDTGVPWDRDGALRLAAIYSEFRPDVVITWDDYSQHPDHRATAKLALDAITLARIPNVVGDAHREEITFLQYYSPYSPKSVIHVDITPSIETVAKVLKVYADFYGWPWRPDDLKALRAVTGREAHVQYAERFNTNLRFPKARELLEI